MSKLIGGLINTALGLFTVFSVTFVVGLPVAAAIKLLQNIFWG